MFVLYCILIVEVKKKLFRRHCLIVGHPVIHCYDTWALEPYWLVLTTVFHVISIYRVHES